MSRLATTETAIPEFARFPQSAILDASFPVPRRFRQHNVVVVEGVQEFGMADKFADVEPPQPAEGRVEHGHACVAGEPRREQETVRLRHAGMDGRRQGPARRMVSVVGNRARHADAHRRVAAQFDQDERSGQAIDTTSRASPLARGSSRRRRRAKRLRPRIPYVNGDLFEGHLRTFSFDTAMRGALLDACRFDWSNISPAIFGALFQSVMDPAERRAQGAHYTTEKNIVKVIEPLFMDDLRAEFGRVRKRRGRGRLAALRQFQAKLDGLTFFDPACGCGNFLIIAYRELRLLEIEVIRDIRDATAATGQAVLDAAWHSVVDVDQFYGIELGEFPVRIAETALWMMDHIMNNRLSLEFGQTFVRIPLEKSPHIVHGDALETDWFGLLPPGDCSFVLGNPPFVGAKYQTAEQRAQVRGIAALGKGGGTLDYVAAWFIKAGEYVKGSEARVGFVATNSITQGEQVAQLWPVLFGRCKLEIAFAHRTFAWGSDARGKAHVHVVILGLDRRKAARAEKRLFSYPDINGDPEESRHAALSPYLFDAGGLSDPHLVVREESAPINGMGRLISGSQPIDDSEYIFNAEERAELLEAEPDAARFLHPYVGAREYLQGGERWILALQDASLTALKALPRVRERMAAVRHFRRKSKRKGTLAIAHYPTRYNVEVIPTSPFLVIPESSSERREYAPIGWLEPPTIPSNLVRILSDATLSDSAMLASAMHMAWLRYIGGRLKSDYRYSIGIVYNTFPTPPEGADLSSLERMAQAVLDARAAHSGATLADLYDPDLMPPNLRRAHQALDRAVDRLYRRFGFASERERVEHLFMLYEKMHMPLATGRKPNPTRRKKAFTNSNEKLMTKNESLLAEIETLIIRHSEGTYWDFKRCHHTNTADLIHDVLCFANANHRGRRFLIFGVDDSDFSLHEISSDPGRRTQADIAGLFRDNARKFFQSRFPDFYLAELVVQGKLLDVLVIEDTPHKPYYLIQKYEKLYPHHIYTRVCDTNTPVTDAAQPHEIERMWRERFGLASSPLDRMKLYLNETDSWVPSNRGGENLLEHHRIFPEFTLRVTDAEEFMARNEEWTRGEIRRDNNHAGYYEVQYHQTCLARVRYVSFDDHKKSMIAPNWEPRGAGRFYFYQANSIDHAVQIWHAAFSRQDHSRALSIRGSGDASERARLRSGRYLTIPVVSKEEVDAFLGHRNEREHIDASQDEDEQYELFLRNLLDFEDWKELQGKNDPNDS